MPRATFDAKGVYSKRQVICELTAIADATGSLPVRGGEGFCAATVDAASKKRRRELANLRREQS